MTRQLITRLEDVCDVDPFAVKIVGIVYCGLGLTRHVGCSRMNRVTDHNGFYRCLDVRFMEYDKNKEQ